jgi:hypothetical protein
MNTSTFRYSGLVHTKSVGVVPSVDKKGVIFVYKKAKKAVSVMNIPDLPPTSFMMNHILRINDDHVSTTWNWRHSVDSHESLVSQTTSLTTNFHPQNKPAESTGRITFKSGQKRTLKKIKNVIKSQKYRPDLQQAALRRASAIYRSQKTKPAKKVKATKKTEA